MTLVPGLGALKALGLGLMVAGACSIAAALVYYGKGKASGRAEVQARWDAVERRRLSEQLAKQAEVRAEEQRQATLQREALNEAERITSRARAAAAAAVDAGRLFVDAAVVGGSGLRPSSAAAATSCSAAVDAAVLPADVLGEIEQRLRDLALEADKRGAAGGLCVGSYDSVTSDVDVEPPAPPD